MAKFKKIMNFSEERAYNELEEVALEYGYKVNIKFGVKDTLPIERSGISSDLYSYALKSHFDFLISDINLAPVFAVEFDGPSHRSKVQRERDEKKDDICHRFELPLLRINDNHLLRNYNKSSILKWIISAWELQKSFDAAQAEGLIPSDEPFDPISLWHHGKTIEERHPHWISLVPLKKISNFYNDGKVAGRIPCRVSFEDENGNYFGVEWIDISPGNVVCVESGMRRQLFPLYLHDLFEQLLTYLLHERLCEYFDGRADCTRAGVVSEKLHAMAAKYRFCGSRTGPTHVKFSPIFRT